MTVEDAIASLPPLREAIKEAALSARKSLGQNFILDLNITRRLAKAAGPLPGVKVVEIGPGPGGLTRGLLLEGAAGVIAIERDERFKPVLEQLAQASQGRLTLLFQDALATDYGAVAAATGASRIVANLPYNIATPLIVGWLTSESWPPWYGKLTVMLQREVAERLVACPGSPNYGRLAVIAQFRASPRILFMLPPSVFVPPPKVASAFIEIVPLPMPADSPPVAFLEKVTAAAFGQRRKMLRSSLSALGTDAMRLLEAAGIDPAQRAERLTVEEFVRIARELAVQSGVSFRPPLK